MQKLVNHFANSVKCPQLLVGPILPSPGPILPIADADADNADVNSDGQINILDLFILVNSVIGT